VRALRGGRGRPFGAAILALLLAPFLPVGDAALRPLRLATFDAYQALAPRVRHRAPALIVAIDEASLAAHGQWPWPRALLARLVAKIAEAGPAAIGDRKSTRLNSSH